LQGFHLLVLLVAGSRIRDTQCGFKVSIAAHFAFSHCTVHSAAEQLGWASSHPAHANAILALMLVFRPRGCAQKHSLLKLLQTLPQKAPPA
jgi:hypothetical protein